MSSATPPTLSVGLLHTATHKMRSHIGLDVESDLSQSPQRRSTPAVKEKHCPLLSKKNFAARSQQLDKEEEQQQWQQQQQQ